MGGAGGAAAPPTFQQEGLSPPKVHMLSLLFNVEPPQLLNHSYAYDRYCIQYLWSHLEKCARACGGARSAGRHQTTPSAVWHHDHVRKSLTECCCQLPVISAIILCLMVFRLKILYTSASVLGLGQIFFVFYLLFYSLIPAIPTYYSQYNSQLNVKTSYIYH